VAGPVTGPAAAPVAVPTSIEGIEQYLRVLWTKLLGTGELDGNANFFDLGGHSLLATQMVSAIRQDLFPGMAMVSVFEAPTIRGLARTLHAEMQAEMHAEIQAAREPGSTAAATASSMSDETSDRSAPIMPTIAGSGENAAPDQQDADLIDRIAGMSDSEVMAELAKFRGEHERGDES
jgi:hypothetical protein